MAQTLSKTLITSPRHMRCPCCDTPLLVVHGDKDEVMPGRCSWLDDGDTIFPLWNMLSAKQKAASAFSSHLMLGNCPNCDCRYYVPMVSFMSGDYDSREGHLNLNVEPLRSRFVNCSLDRPAAGVPSDWICQECETTDGAMHLHMFGPFDLESDYGAEYGAAASAWTADDHGAHLLLALWDELQNPFVASTANA